MSKTAVIHQPDFLSYLGFFHRLLKVDIYIALDCVQFVTKTSRSWQHRDKIKTPQGDKWLTMGIQKAPTRTNISDILLSESDSWRRDNLNLVRENYRKAPFFAQVFPQLESLYALKVRKMVEFNLASIRLLMDMFDIKTDIVMASSVNPHGNSNELLVDILTKTGCDTYLSGVGARAYHCQETFDKAGIKVLWQEFAHPVYPQLHGVFIPYLSSIDLLFNCGIEKSREIIRSIS
ncbi:MAG: WbqC family protein [Elusimicrobiales bacterium]|nr:WbqC family protein [Elusimicrobiales bacterium]